MLSEPNISYKPFWGICRPLNSWRANSPNPIQIYCANKKRYAQNISFKELEIPSRRPNDLKRDFKELLVLIILHENNKVQLTANSVHL